MPSCQEVSLRAAKGGQWWVFSAGDDTSQARSARQTGMVMVATMLTLVLIVELTITLMLTLIFTMTLSFTSR